MSFFMLIVGIKGCAFCIRGSLFIPLIGVLERIVTCCVHSHSCAQADLQTFRRTRLLLHMLLTGLLSIGWLS